MMCWMHSYVVNPARRLMKHRVMYQSEFGNLGYCRGEGKQQKKVHSKSQGRTEPSEWAIRLEMDIIKPDFAVLTWEQWKDTHTEVSMAMSLCALMYTYTHACDCLHVQASASAFWLLAYVQDVNKCIKARQLVYKNDHQSETWKASLAKVKVFYHNRCNALSSKKRKLETADGGMTPQ